MNVPLRLIGGSAVLLALCGCASTERMSRMSGGVIQEYSVPSQQRIRSEKFQKHTKQFAKPRDGLVGKVEETPVNIWPFFFRSEYYTSILWPFVDWDAFGFAVRPFYNQEGDEYSVLFPLTAWNASDGDGWVLLFSWNKAGWLFFPLAARNETKEELWRYYTPLFIQNKDLRPLSWEKPRRSSFTELLLGYHRHERILDRGGWWKLFQDDSLDAAQKRFIAYKLAGTGRAVPANKTGLRKLRDDVAATLPVKEEKSVGFIPLFHVSWDRTGHNWRALAYLMGGESRPRHFEWDVFGQLLMGYEARGHEKWTDRERMKHTWGSFVLMSFFQKREELIREGKFRSIEKLYDYSRDNRSVPKFRRVLPDVRAELKKLDPALELPPTVTDGMILEEYLDELGRSPRFRDSDLPFHTVYDGGFIPLFLYERSDDPERKNYWCSPVTLTYHESRRREWNFWSIPILTFAGSDPDSDWTYVVPPLGWSSKTSRRRNADVPIHAADTRWAQEKDCVSERGDYAVCGLFYRGEMSYRAAKPNLDHAAAEAIRTGLPRMFRDRREARERRAELEKNYRKEQRYQPKPDDEVDACEKQLKLAKIRRSLRRLEADEAERLRKYQVMRRDAEKLGFALEAEFPTEEKQVEQALERLFAAATEVHSQRDVGSGLFYRKEICHNGDSKWHFCGFLAGGEKAGEREHMHVLQYLYRFRRDGKRMEKIYFPFVSIREDEHGSRTSFMGRVWQKTVKDGKSGGYICFIPFGEL
ncbi:MAG: hypothetical protein IJJ28_07365 [Lentisphaeria bacterium]|nr:hypothetical protein [Lentisphaeria bacterium]